MNSYLKELKFGSSSLLLSLFLLVSSFSFAQQAVKGTVTDELGPVVGANILIKVQQ